MTPEDFAPLEISRYELRLRAQEACALPPFLGSTLRGAFGHALKQAVFVTDGRDCNGCDAADPCVYHYLFETPVPPGVAQLRGQREAPVPFILSPPIVQNPVRRVWRIPAVRGASASARSLRQLSRSGIDSQSATRNSQSGAQRSSILDTQSSSPLGGFARNSSNPQSEIRDPQFGDPQSEIRNPKFGDPQSAISSVVFPDQPRRFAAGDTLSFDLALIGRATEYLRYVVLAVDEMARRGLGANRARFELKEVWRKGSASCQLAAESSKSACARAEPMPRELIYAAGAPASRLACAKAETSRLVQLARPLSELIRERLAELKFPPSEENSSCSPSLEEAIATSVAELANPVSSGPLTTEHRPLTTCLLGLRFLTPTRIRVKGDLQTDLSFELLVRNLLRRVSTLAAVHGRASMDLDYRGLIERAASVETRSSRLVWWDLDRYSNRQQTKMKLGGFIGEVEYEGEAVEGFLPLLVVGELLNIGTGTSFGLGSYRILECGDSSPLS